MANFCYLSLLLSSLHFKYLEKKSDSGTKNSGNDQIEPFHREKARVRTRMKIDSEMDHTVPGDLHLHAVAAHGFVIIPSMQSESAICKSGGLFILSDIFFVTFCAVAALRTHKIRQALRARKYRLSKC